MRIHIRHRQSRQLSEINVVPYIDVMLVLLVIFMITTPLAPDSFPVETAQSGKGSSGDLYLIYVNEQRVIKAGPKQEQMSISQLAETSAQALSEAPATRFAIHASDEIPYRIIVDIMAALKKGGATKVGLVQTISNNQ